MRFERSVDPACYDAGPVTEPQDASPTPAFGASRNAKIAAVLGAILIVGSAKYFGVLDAIGEPQALAKTMVDLGGWGYLAFILAYTLLQPFGVPGTIFVFTAPLIWPWPVAFALSMVGTMTASVVGFSFARFVARDWIEPRVPRRFKRYNEALERRAFLTVFTLRLVFWMPQVLHSFLGVSKVPFWTHFWGSFAGYLLPLFLVSFFGQRLVDWMKTASTGQWIAVGIGTLTLFASMWAFERWRGARNERATKSADPSLD